jgi:type I restriction enzyme S subunit
VSPTVPLKRVATVIAGQSPPSDAVSTFDEAELPFLQGNAEFGSVHPSARLQCLSAPKRAQMGDVLLSVRAPVGALNIADQPYGIGRGLCAIRPDDELDASYAWWAITAASAGLQAVATGSTYDAVTAEDVERLPMPVRPIEEQPAIADYLDRETRRIDALIAAKQRMIQLVDERIAIDIRQRLLATEHMLAPLKRTWRIADCKHVTPQYTVSGFPVVSPGDATPGRINLTRAHRFVSEDDFRTLTDGGRTPQRGDIIYSRNASIGIASYVDTDEPFCMGQDVCLITSDRADQLFLMYFLNTLGLDQLEEMKLGSTFSRINVAQIADLSVPTPSLDEQRRVASEADELTRHSGDVARPLNRQVDLLRERRQALITAAVTGQIEIPLTA